MHQIKDYKVTSSTLCPSVSMPSLFQDSLFDVCSYGSHKNTFPSQRLDRHGIATELIEAMHWRRSQRAAAVENSDAH